MKKIPFRRALPGNASNSEFQAVVGVQALHELADSVRPQDFAFEDVLKTAVDCMMLPPMPNPYHPEDDPFDISMMAFDVADPRAIAMAMEMEISPRARFGIDWDQLERTPELMRFQDSFHTWHFPSACPGLQNHELGKFIVQKNEVGVVFNIQTGMTMSDLITDFRWPRGDPFYYTRTALYSGPGFPAPKVLWHLRIERLDPTGFDPTIWRTFPPDRLPGSAFPILPQWDEMRFQYGEDHMVHLVVPENSVLSLWIQRIEVGGDTPVRNVSGVLQGITQPQGSPRTYENLTRSYGL